MGPHSHSLLSQNGSPRIPQAFLLLLRTTLAGPDVHVAYTDLSGWQTINQSIVNLVSLLNPFIRQGDRNTLNWVGMVELTALCGLGSALWIWSKRNRDHVSSDGSTHATDATDVDAVATDPGLLKKHSTIREYTVQPTGITYPAIRTFYRPHPQEEKLPQKPRPVPLLVFVHGLGGSVAQFNSILISLSNLASCLAIDLPGCGRSSFAPTSWEGYTTEALVQLLAVVIEAHRDQHGHQQVVLVGHSMGCSLATLLASSSSPFAHLISEHVGGLIAICPQADPPTKKQCRLLTRVAAVPGLLFDMYRRLDRIGGVNSASVVRMTGKGADEETKRLQLRFNRQSRTRPWQRMARGMCPDYSTGSPKGGLPGQDVWAGLEIPVFLVGGDADQITPIENVKRIVKFLGRDVTAIGPPSEEASLSVAAAPLDPARVEPEMAERKHHDSGVDAGDLPGIDDDTPPRASSSNYSRDQIPVHTEAESSTGESAVITDTGADASDSGSSNLPMPHPRRLVVKTEIMAKPAGHSLLFAPPSSRILSGLIGSFLANHIDARLSHAWQLKYLSTEGKWDVKNLKKWQAVQPVSLPIADTFRAMKTLREVDEEHSPKMFVKQWAGKLYAVIDISHDTPVYDPKGLVEGGIAYHKFPTVSKQPPTREEVRNFVELVDKIQVENEGKEGLIGVHCHYGFNRTGFFVVSYLIEKLKYRVQDALDTFQKARPPGIRHDHFIDELHVRYASGLRKAPTM